MAKRAASDKPDPMIVLGDHPSAWLLSLLLREADLPVLQVIPKGHKGASRQQFCHRDLFSLHKALEKAHKTLNKTAIWAIEFAGDEKDQLNEHRTKSACGYVLDFKDVQQTLTKAATAAGVTVKKAGEVDIASTDGRNHEVSIDGQIVTTPMIAIVDGEYLSLAARLGLRVTEQPLKLTPVLSGIVKNVAEAETRASLPVALNLLGTKKIATMLHGPERCELMLIDPGEQGKKLMERWLNTLQMHQKLPGDASISSMSEVELPLVSAMQIEHVGSRAVLVGPAGGFYSQLGEDIYPNCASAKFAAEVIVEAMKQEHVQDALHPYRNNWRVTLGQYLQQPPSSIHWLLPLVYRNTAMASRLGESLLTGQTLVGTPDNADAR